MFETERTKNFIERKKKRKEGDKLTNHEKHLLNQAIINQLELEDEEINELKNRKINIDQAKQFGFRSFLLNKQVFTISSSTTNTTFSQTNNNEINIKNFEITERQASLLPGVTITNDKKVVTTGKEGLLIPVKSELGEIVALQIRPRRKYQMKGVSKYVLTSSNSSSSSKKKKQETNFHYNEFGETPLCYHPFSSKENENIIGFCEGILKSYIAANRLKMNIIGGNGCDFIISIETLDQMLRNMKDDISLKIAYIFPDSGTHCNEQVLVPFIELYMFLETRFKEVWFVYYGQYTKEKGMDIDEVPEEVLNEEKQLLNLYDYCELTPNFIREKNMLGFYFKEEHNKRKSNKEEFLL
ncbi:hypothetical protein ABK040_010150 [Willaertia magna]